MKILYVHPHDIYSPLEPWTIRVVSLAKQLRKMGHEVKIVYFSAKAFPNILLPEGIQTICLNRNNGPHIFISNTIKLIRLSRWADILHFQKCHHYCSVPALIAAFLNKIPIHYDWDDLETNIFVMSAAKKGLSTFIIKSYFKFLERTIPRLADSVSVSSDGLSDICVKNGISNDKIFKISVAADLELFASTQGEDLNGDFDLKAPIVLYHGQLHSCQYVNLLIEAAEHINDVKINFVVVGDGSNKNRLVDLAKSKKNISMHFLGYVKHECIPALLRKADICVAPFEDNEVTRCKSPLKIVEYMAAGKPIVASDVGEVSIMLQDAAVLVEPSNSMALAEGIRFLLDNGAVGRDMGLKARKRAQDLYNWHVSALILLKAYDYAFSIHA